MTAKDHFLSEFSKAVSDGAAAVFIGAGVSVGAGYPSWKQLLEDIGEELGVRSHDVQDLAALAQWSIRKSSGRTRVLTVIREKIGMDRSVPAPLEVLARLPIRNFWTTNYDRLIERAFSDVGRPMDVVSSDKDLAIRTRPGAARLYKMHGTIDRLEDLVISTDDYELYRKTRGSFRPLLHAHLTTYSTLFVGLSFTDPNLRHVLSMIRESFADAPPEHFAIVRPPQQDEFGTEDEFKARYAQHRLWADDLKRYGLEVVEIEEYAEVPQLFNALERRIARSKVWVSGSWPLEHAGSRGIAEFCEHLGREIEAAGLSLVVGSGLTVAAATIDGLIGALQRSAAWDWQRRLLVRPFAQPLAGEVADADQWNRLRAELARLAGAIVFVGGTKVVDGALVLADGVARERELAEEAGVFLLPVGSTGGQAEQVAQSLLGSSLPSTGSAAQRPTDDELQNLLAERDATKLARLVSQILRRHAANKG